MHCHPSPDFTSKTQEGGFYYDAHVTDGKLLEEAKGPVRGEADGGGTGMGSLVS